MKEINGLDKTRVMPIVRAALKEDIGRTDITTFATIEKLASIRSGIIARNSGVICGLPIIEMILNIVDYSVRIKPTVDEGAHVSEGKEIIFIEGHTRAILMTERTILNFLGHLSGIATKTRKFVDKVKKYDVKIMDTRKTTPLFRYLEKYAVRVGGGHNHRMGLWDQMLIKDNHINAARCLSGLSPSKMPTITDIVSKAKQKKQKNIKLEVEVENLKQFEQALKAGPDIIMLDNMNVKSIEKAVAIRNERRRRKTDQKILLEASGGITLDNVEEYAACGVDRISIGSLTSSVESFDAALEVVG